MLRTTIPAAPAAMRPLAGGYTDVELTGTCARFGTITSGANNP
jgi:hypothetical protein